MRLKRLLAVTALLAGFIGSAMPAHAGSVESHIDTDNATKVWVWVTAYSLISGWKIEGAWCVGPGQYDRHGLRAMILKVRFEVTKNHGCAHPVLLDESLQGPRKDLDESRSVYTIHEENSHFVISGVHAPM